MKRTLTSLNGNSQMLDGGAMYGNAPKALWSRWSSPDTLNRIPLACRCLLVREGDRLILFETGVGAFFEPKLRSRYGVVEDRHVLLDNLSLLGIEHHQIDTVVLSHLHFDHAGGLLSAYTPERPSELLFPNARFVVGAQAWARALAPHPRDRASFIPRIQQLLEASGRLTLVEEEDASVLGEGYRFHLSHGHTPGLLLTEIPMPLGPVLFAGDLVPGTPWVNQAITMGYDRFPELLINEKTTLLADLTQRHGRLFYTHDPRTALSGLLRNGRGRFEATEPLASVRELSQ